MKRINLNRILTLFELAKIILEKKLPSYCCCRTKPVDQLIIMRHDVQFRLGKLMDADNFPERQIGYIRLLMVAGKF